MFPLTLGADAKADSTRQGYCAAAKRFGVYLKGLGLDDAVDAQGLPLAPTPEEHILNFLGVASQQEGKKDKQPSFSAINNYASAIKFYHKEAGHPLSSATVDKIGTFLTGSSIVFCGGLCSSLITPDVPTCFCMQATSATLRTRSRRAKCPSKRASRPLPCPAMSLCASR